MLCAFNSLLSKEYYKKLSIVYLICTIIFKFLLLEKNLILIIIKTNNIKLLVKTFHAGKLNGDLNLILLYRD